jgi:hypothetical protein
MRDIMRQRPEEPSCEAEFAELVDRLDPPTAILIRHALREEARYRS